MCKTTGDCVYLKKEKCKYEHNGNCLSLMAQGNAATIFLKKLIGEKNENKQSQKKRKTS